MKEEEKVYSNFDEFKALTAPPSMEDASIEVKLRFPYSFFELYEYISGYSGEPDTGYPKPFDLINIHEVSTLHDVGEGTLKFIDVNALSIFIKSVPEAFETLITEANKIIQQYENERI